MNNSIDKKMDTKQKIIFKNDLSSTSSDFILNYNKKYIKQKGGKCDCKDMINAITEQNFNLILYILKKNNCCFKCQNAEGNTILHLLVSFYNNDKIKSIVCQLLNKDCRDFINIQNNQGQTPILLAVMNNEHELAEKLENAGADGSIEDNNGNFVESKDADMLSSQINESLTTSSNVENNLKENVFINKLIVLKPQEAELKSQETDLTSLNLTDFNNESDLQSTDIFMKEYKPLFSDKKESNINSTDVFVINNKDSTSSSDNNKFSDMTKFNLINTLLNNNVSTNVKNNNSQDIDMDKYIDSLNQNNTNESSNHKTFLKINNNTASNNNTSSVKSENLLKAIMNIKGGTNLKKQTIVGFRKFNMDSDDFTVVKKNNKSNNSVIDYNQLYNSDSEFGNKSKNSKSYNNELSRMMISQKDKLHSEVLDMIMSMLNKGVLLQLNKPIEASEKNAKLIKAHLYKQISEKNPQMGGMDKILALKTMSETEIINMVKKLPNLDELEKSIQKHLEEKNKKKLKDKTLEPSDSLEKKQKKKKKNSDETLESSEETEKSEKKSKKNKKSSK